MITAFYMIKATSHTLSDVYLFFMKKVLRHKKQGQSCCFNQTTIQAYRQNKTPVLLAELAVSQKRLIRHILCVCITFRDNTDYLISTKL